MEVLKTGMEKQKIVKKSLKATELSNVYRTMEEAKAAIAAGTYDLKKSIVVKNGTVYFLCE